jgi:phage-related holin
MTVYAKIVLFLEVIEKGSLVILHTVTAELMFHMNYKIIRKVVLNHMS